MNCYGINKLQFTPKMCIVILPCYEVKRQLPHDLNEHVEMTLERKRTL